MPGMNRSKKMMMMMTFVQIQNEWIKLRRNLFILFHRSNWIANSLKWNEIQENGFWFGFFLFYYQKKRRIYIIFKWQSSSSLRMKIEERTNYQQQKQKKKHQHYSFGQFIWFIHSFNEWYRWWWKWNHFTQPNIIFLFEHSVIFLCVL